MGFGLLGRCSHAAVLRSCTGLRAGSLHAALRTSSRTASGMLPAAGRLQAVPCGRAVQPAMRQLRWATQAAASAPPQAAAAVQSDDHVDKGMSVWLYTCAGMVFLIVMVGGITRLTESGLSIAYWRPVTGMIPPLTEADWEHEFEIYKATPEYKQNAEMDLNHFKFIFFWEWFHRALGRAVGIVYFAPLCYFAARGRPQRLGITPRLLLLGSLGGLQGAIGWIMVKSGLEHRNFEDGSKATVSPYRLALHLGTAFVLFLGLTSTATHLRRGTIMRKAPPQVRPLMPFVHGALGVVYATAMTGAAVAGLDAGWIYCEFPTMGNGYIPPAQELFLEKCASFWPRNLYENPVFAQFTHRCMAMASLTAVAALSLKARNPAVAAALRGTPAAKALLAVQILTVWQVALGIHTLMAHTPIPQAVMHQASSLLVLTSLITLQVLLAGI